MLLCGAAGAISDGRKAADEEPADSALFLKSERLLPKDRYWPFCTTRGMVFPRN